MDARKTFHSSNSAKSKGNTHQHHLKSGNKPVATAPERKDVSLPGLPLAQVIAMYSRDRGVEDGKLVQGPVVTFNIFSAEGRPTKIDFWDL